MDVNKLFIFVISSSNKNEIYVDGDELNEFHIFKPINSFDKENTLVEFKKSCLKINNNDNFDYGTIANWLTRYKILKYQIDNNIPYLCILEDNIFVKPYFVDFLNNECKKKLKNEYINILKIGKYDECYMTSLNGSKRLIDILEDKGIISNFHVQLRNYKESYIKNDYIKKKRINQFNCTSININLNAIKINSICFFMNGSVSEISLKFIEQIKNYDIYVITSDSISQKLINKYLKIHFVTVISINKYCDILYNLFFEKYKYYNNIWCIGSNIFIKNSDTFENIDKKYGNYDLLTNSNSTDNSTMSYRVSNKLVGLLENKNNICEVTITNKLKMHIPNELSLVNLNTVKGYRYRLFDKDGSYIWVNKDYPKKLKNNHMYKCVNNHNVHSKWRLIK
tara:strand:- start:2090 stop:3274 length:1185 start_codon:yes stop_codon:yes gene_type:complete